MSKGIPDRVAPHVAVVTGIARARDAGAPQSQIIAQYQQLEKFGYTLDQARDWSRRHHSTEALRKIATEMETHLATLQLH